MQTDTLLYRLFQERPATLFELAGLPGDGTGYRLTASEVKETAFRLDGVLLPPEAAPPEWPLLFLENQFQALRVFYSRWLAAIFLYLYREAVERPWIAVAVFPTRDLEPPLGPAFAALEPAGLLRRVYLEDLLKEGAVDGASLGVRLLRLVAGRGAMWWPSTSAGWIPPPGPRPAASSPWPTMPGTWPRG